MSSFDKLIKSGKIAFVWWVYRGLPVGLLIYALFYAALYLNGIHNEGWRREDRNIAFGISLLFPLYGIIRGRTPFGEKIDDM